MAKPQSNEMQNKNNAITKRYHLVKIRKDAEYIIFIILNVLLLCCHLNQWFTQELILQFD